METAGAAGKLRELIALGGEAIEGPWDGEEAITCWPTWRPAPPAP
jgi:4-hydroxy-tetrahydrodipicolinate synthase